MVIDIGTLEADEANPLDLVEDMAAENAWDVVRSGPGDLSLRVEGEWCGYQMFLTWQPEISALLFACAYELRAPEPLRSQIAELVARINEWLIVGHFDLWIENGLIVYRHSLLLRGQNSASFGQLEDLVDICVRECERFYPSFQFVVWGGKTPREAFDAAILKPLGEA